MRVTSARFSQAVKTPTLRKPRKSSKSKDGGVVDVVNESLCDDILYLLKPTLPTPKTCDIIDFNPGKCLWSQKLHDVLQPRRHVLVEPRREAFNQYIGPLLRQSNSAYRYAPDIKTALDVKEQLLSEETYKFRKHLPEERQNQYLLNPNLLITANLCRIARRVKGFTGSEAKQFLNDYYRSIFIKDDYIHRYGLARLLAWISEDTRISVLPNSVNSRTKQSVQLESTCTIDLVAAPLQSLSLHPTQARWFELEQENQDEVHEQQKQLKLKIPAARRQPAPIPPFTSLSPSVEEVRNKQDLYPHHQHSIKRLLDLDVRLATEDPEFYAKYQAESQDRFSDTTRYRRQEKSSPEQKAYRTHMMQLRTHHNTYLKARDLIWEQRSLAKKFQRGWESGWFSRSTGLPVSGPNQQEATNLIKDADFLHERVRTVKADTKGLINKAVDDYRSFDSHPRNLAWNNRQYDPLLVQDKEFSPKTLMSLLSFIPHAGAAIRLDSVDKQICFDYVCTVMSMYPLDTVLQGIKRLVPAGEDQFLERLPELRDPTKGGWFNLEQIRARTLHPDLIISIALAFYDWPHRPPIPKIMIHHRTMFEEGPL